VLKVAKSQCGTRYWFIQVVYLSQPYMHYLETELMKLNFQGFQAVGMSLIVHAADCSFQQRTPSILVHSSGVP